MASAQMRFFFFGKIPLGIIAIVRNGTQITILRVIRVSSTVVIISNEVNDIKKKIRGHVSMNLPGYAVPKCSSNNHCKTIALELLLLRFKSLLYFLFLLTWYLFISYKSRKVSVLSGSIFHHHMQSPFQAICSS